MSNQSDESSVVFRALKTTLLSKNITVSKHRTSVRLEPEMWDALKDISRREGCTIHDVCTLVHLRKPPGTSLTAAIRVFLMLYYRLAATEEGHRRAGHGSFENMRERARMKNEESAADSGNNTKIRKESNQQPIRKRA